MSSSVRVGVIGLGAMGHNHVRVYSELQCELVGVADVNYSLAKEIGEQYHTRYFADYHELLSMVDAVSIAVPTTYHHDVVMDVLRSDVHCLVEKPIAINLEESDEMIKIANRKHLNLAVGHIERFNPAVIKLKEIIDQRILGHILIISTRRVGPFATRIRDVGVIIDSATHDIGVIRYLLGKDPVSMYARIGSINHISCDHAVIVMDFDDTTACIEANWFTPHKVRTLVATGVNGIAYLDYIEQKLSVYSSNNEGTVYIPKEEPLKIELNDFLRSITDQCQPSVDGIEGYAILKIALEAGKREPVLLI
ncbi:MAG: Gfo/Idh/MocA family oxidoreductase [Chitinispirillaceae bacterium]|nr:Gfo/Idh/MocA family oxidoreductase [Chitinispirillaceae bacterium]